MTPRELDDAAIRLEEIGAEEEKLRSKLLREVEQFGFTPPRAEKSKRLEGSAYQLTVSRGLTTEIKDSEVERIRQACPSLLFDSLFRTITKYKLAEGATSILARRLPPDAPSRLRMMFSRAVETKETSPRLRIEKLDEAECTSQTAAS